MTLSAPESASDSSCSSLVAELADEFSDRLSAGETPEIETYVQRAPHVADVIRDVLRSLQLMHELRLESPALASSAQFNEVSVARGTIGEYEILEEVGRGGMGVVYRARQFTLDRIVALKVLPFAASLDPIKLKRFRLETQSASMIQHPNVVAIYGVGCDRGSHYYAMQFIDGHPLDRWIVELRAASERTSCSADVSNSCIRTDTTTDCFHATEATHVSWSVVTNNELSNFRKFAEIAYQAADALHHAHELGVIHRDIKPSNLMIDHSGKVWVTDFGLAHVETQGTLTATGDLLGTLRYMSPEQAIGGHARVDRRSDVYSLGATLFELLTLEPLLPGTDRHTLLRQLTQNEPRSLRRIKPKIPIDLETIVLKAVARLPEQRYATAADFAADLKRFLNDQSILAKRPSLMQVVTRWIRKHKTATWLMAALPLLALVGLSMSNIAISYQRNRAEKALSIAQRNESKAVGEAKKANAIRLVLQQLLDSANPDQSKGTNYTVRQLLDDFSTSQLESLEDQPEVEASLRSTVGNAYRRIGAPDKARPHLIRALELRQRATEPNVADVASSLEDLAWNEGASGDYPKATQLATQAVELYKEVSAQSIHAQWCLQHCWLYVNQFEASDAIAEKALEDCERLTTIEPVMANVLHDMSTSKNRQGLFEEAETLARRSVELHLQLHGPSHPETGWGRDALARALAAQDKWEEAIENFHEAIKIFKLNYPKDHSSIRYASELLQSALIKSGKKLEADQIEQERLATGVRAWLVPAGGKSPSLLGVLADRKQFIAAGELVMNAPELFEDNSLCTSAIEILCRYYDQKTRRFGPFRLDADDQKWLDINKRLYDHAIDNCPDVPSPKNSVAWLLVSNPDSRLHRAELACELASQAVDRNPDEAAFWNTLGVAQYRAGRFVEANESLERSRAKTKNDEYDLIFLSMTHLKLGNRSRAREFLTEGKSKYLARNEKNEEFEQFLEEAIDLIKTGD